MILIQLHSLLLLRYITKENLQYLFGNDFPDEEIDLLMIEAGSRNGRGISFADFMAQWNDDKEEFEREWRKHMFEEVIVNDSKDSNKNDDVISEISFILDSDSDSDPAREISSKARHSPFARSWILMRS